MPARSEAQRRFIYGVKGKAFAKAHHFDNKGKLPSHVGAGVKAKRCPDCGLRKHCDCKE